MNIETTLGERFLELRSEGIALRIPRSTDEAPPAWSVKAVTSLVTYHTSPDTPAFGPRHRIPVGMALDMAQSRLTGFLFAVHPEVPDTLLAVGITEAERMHSDRGPAVLLDLLQARDPDLVTDPARADWFDDPAFVRAFDAAVEEAPDVGAATSDAFRVERVGTVYGLTIPASLVARVRAVPHLLSEQRDLTLSSGAGQTVRIVGGSHAGVSVADDGVVVVTLEPSHANPLADWTGTEPVVAGPVVFEPESSDAVALVTRAHDDHTLLQTMGLRSAEMGAELRLRWPLHKWLGDGERVLEIAVQMPALAPGMGVNLGNGLPMLVLTAVEDSDAPLLEMVPSPPWDAPDSVRADAFEAAARALYGDAEPARRWDAPFHEAFWSYSEVLPRVRSVLAFDAGDHWHFVTVGAAETPMPDGSMLDHERTLRVVKQEEPAPWWAALVLLIQAQAMAKRGVVEPEGAVGAQGIPYEDREHPLVPVVMVADPDLGEVTTPAGVVKGLQTLFLTIPESLQAGPGGDLAGLLASRRAASPKLVSDPDGEAPDGDAAALTRLMQSKGMQKHLAEAVAKVQGDKGGAVVVETLRAAPGFCAIDLYEPARVRIEEALLSGEPVDITDGDTLITFTPTTRATSSRPTQAGPNRFEAGISGLSVQLMKGVPLPITFGPLTVLFPRLPDDPLERLHELAYLTLWTQSAWTSTPGKALDDAKRAMASRAKAPRDRFSAMLEQAAADPAIAARLATAASQRTPTQSAAHLLLAGSPSAIEEGPAKYRDAVVAWVSRFRFDDGLNEIRACLGLPAAPPRPPRGSQAHRPSTAAPPTTPSESPAPAPPTPATVDMTPFGSLQESSGGNSMGIAIGVVVLLALVGAVLVWL